MNKENLAFTRINFILLAVGMLVVILGFILMAGVGTSEDSFNPDIFSALRVKVAPVICFAGFVLVIVAILFPAKKNMTENNAAENKITQTK